MAETFRKTTNKLRKEGASSVSAHLKNWVRLLSCFFPAYRVIVDNTRLFLTSRSGQWGTICSFWRLPLPTYHCQLATGHLSLPTCHCPLPPATAHLPLSTAQVRDRGKVRDRGHLPLVIKELGIVNSGQILTTVHLLIDRSLSFLIYKVNIG